MSVKGYTLLAPVPFNMAWKWINDQKQKYSLPGCGPLGMYMLIADMHAAGLVSAPLTENMGSVLLQLNAGGLKGLRLLKYLPRNGGSSSQNVSAAFKKFYDDVHDALTPEERVDFSWNTVVAEHTLCKYLRMTNKSEYLP